MTRNLMMVLAIGVLALAARGSTSAVAAEVKIQPAVLQQASGDAVPTISLLSTRASDAQVTPVRWGRYYAYRPYYGRPYRWYGYRPYYRGYRAPYYGYYAPYAPYGAYYGGPAYW